MTDLAHICRWLSALLLFAVLYVIVLWRLAKHKPVLWWWTSGWKRGR